MQFDTQSLTHHAQCIISKDAVHAYIRSLGAAINAHYGSEEVVLWSVLNGAMVFTGQLLPHLQMPVTVDYVHATRYNKNTPSENLHWFAKPVASITGKNLLICDDIFDLGFTLQAVVAFAEAEGAKTVATAVMAFKELQRDHPFRKPDFIAFSVPDKYVFGMGMDYNGYWRNAPGIWVAT